VKEIPSDSRVIAVLLLALKLLFLLLYGECKLTTVLHQLYTHNKQTSINYTQHCFHASLTCNINSDFNYT